MLDIRLSGICIENEKLSHTDNGHITVPWHGTLASLIESCC